MKVEVAAKVNEVRDFGSDVVVKWREQRGRANGVIIVDVEITLRLV